MRKSCRKWFPTQVGLLFGLGTRFGVDFCVFGVSGGSLWRPLWTQEASQGSPGGAQGPPKSGPGTPKSVPRGSGRPSWDPPGSSGGPRARSGSHFDPSGMDFASILDRFRCRFSVRVGMRFAARFWFRTGFPWPRWRTSGSDWVIDSDFDLASDRHGGAHREAIGCVTGSDWDSMVAAISHAMWDSIGYSTG